MGDSEMANQNYLQLNKRERVFVQEMLKKKPSERDLDYQCYCAEIAGYKGRQKNSNRSLKYKGKNPMEGAARRLMGNPRVLAALEGFKMEDLIGNEFGPDHIKRKLLRIAQANMLDFAEWDKDSVRFKDSSTLTRAQGECIISVSQTVTKNGGSIKIERINPLDALDKLARIHGMYKDSLEITDPAEKELSELSDEEIRTGMSAILARRPDLADALRRAVVDSPGAGAGAEKKV